MQATCDSCSAPIIFIVVANNAGRKPRRMPVNPDPDPGGNVAVRIDGAGTRIGRVLGRDQKPAGGERLYCPHFATCTHPERHRRFSPNSSRTAPKPKPAANQPSTLPGLDTLL
jgi:hypothetical protein